MHLKALKEALAASFFFEAQYYDRPMGILDDTLNHDLCFTQGPKTYHVILYSVYVSESSGDLNIVFQLYAVFNTLWPKRNKI